MSPKVVVGIIMVIVILMIAVTPMKSIADRNNHPHSGNNGQCIKINRELDLGGSKEDCRDTFTGKDHNNPPPLP